MNKIITVLSLCLFVASCSCFKHKEGCCQGDHKSCETKCQHDGKDHKCEGEGKKCPMHAAPTEQVSEQPSQTPTPTATPTPVPAKKKKP